MQYTKTDRGYVIRLMQGKNIHQELINFCNQAGISSGSFTGIGALSAAELGLYDPNKKEYRFKTFTQPLEIASLTGNVSVVDGEPFLHIHAVLADDACTCFGGHLKSATVGPTCEIFFTATNKPINRELDQVTGLKLLNLG